MIFISIFLIHLKSSNGIEVLGILPFESKSHFAIGDAIMKSLAEFYHNVTVVSPYPVKRELYFYKNISIGADTRSDDYEYEEGCMIFFILNVKFLCNNF